jgi:hypothetical protein
MKGCLRFSTVMFRKLPNFGQIQVGSITKLEEKKKKTAAAAHNTYIIHK